MFWMCWGISPLEFSGLSARFFHMSRFPETLPPAPLDELSDPNLTPPNAQISDAFPELDQDLKWCLHHTSYFFKEQKQ